MNFIYKDGGREMKKFQFYIIIFILGFHILSFPCYAQEITPTQDQKISLDIKGMDIVDVLKMLAQRSGLNIVVGKNVTGKVTLFLKDVDIQDALELILLANDLAYEKKADILNVMTQRDYELIYGERYQDKKQAKLIQLKYAKAADLSRALTQIKTNIGKIVVDEGSNTLVLIDTPAKIKEMEDFIKSTDLLIQTEVFGLNYAQADKIQPKIQETLTKGIGYLRIDERTNKIVVTDYPQKLDEIAKIVTAFDEKTPQVLIDAQIIEIKPSDKFQMGVDWDYWLKKNFRTTLKLVGGSTIGFGINRTVDSVGDYKMILDILRTIGDTKILSSPRIMAVNNQEAKILVGTKDAYITSTTSQGTGGTTVTSQSVNFVDVGIKLYVTPTINRDGFVSMKIKPEISSAERKPLISQGQTTDVPIVTTSETETTVMVKDGVTIIIGGLKKDERNKTVTKIPLIGDIPLIGFLFRSTSDELKQTELVILLTPHIMSGETSYSDFSEIKPQDGAVVRMEKGQIITKKIVAPKKEEKSDEEAIFSYYQVVTEKIIQFARLSSPKDIGEVNLSFTVSSQGQLLDEPKAIDATNSSLVPFAIKSVKDASPFPFFPQNLKKSQESFRILIEYK